MKQKVNLIHARLKMPRAAALAGILFSVFLIAGLLLLQLPGDSAPRDAYGRCFVRPTGTKACRIAGESGPLSSACFFRRSQTRSKT